MNATAAAANETTAAPARTVDEAMSHYARGDAGAFATVYAFVAPRVASYLRRRVRDEARVPDLVQQTFLHMHRARATFLGGAQVLPWAFAIARRQLVDAYRAGEREAACAAGVEPDGDVTTHASVDAEALLAAKQTAGRVEVALAGLSRPQRAAYELVKGDGLTLVEAAAALGTSVTGVKLRTHRAYAALRLALAPVD